MFGILIDIFRIVVNEAALFMQELALAHRNGLSIPSPHSL